MCSDVGRDSGNTVPINNRVSFIIEHTVVKIGHTIYRKEKNISFDPNRYR